MRALLVSNPNATTTTPMVTEVITSALSAELKLDVEVTKRRNHAGYLAAGAVHEGYELVIALGGDGTLNEVIQGIAGTDVALGIIPGGSTNVYARTLGIPNNAVEATGALLRKVRERNDRWVNIGRADDRWFAFCAGYGFDAEVVRYVEQRHRLKRTVRQASFLWCGLLAWLRGYDRSAEIRMTIDGERVEDPLRSLITCATTPYTFLQSMPIHLCPHADPAAGLDASGMTSLRLWSLLRLVSTTLRDKPVESLSFARLFHDAAEIVVESDSPLPLQLDGDFVGERERVTFTSAERALRIMA